LKDNKYNKDFSWIHEIVNCIKTNEAVNIVVKYGIFGVLWIILSDRMLEMLSADFEIYRHLQTYKGWIYVLITMMLLYILISRMNTRIHNATWESLKAMKELKRLAYYDTLTGLPNRTMFVNKIKNLARSTRGKFAIAFFDIDNFKYINDTMGHYVGDDFLKFLGKKMSIELQSPNMVARLGGDEFAVLFKDYETKENLLNMLERMKNNIGNTWNSGGREFFISMSVGVAVFPDDGYDFDTLFKHSDIAMYAAKKEGKNKIFFYEEGIQNEAIRHMHMANKLQKGLDNKEFELYYQPQIELETGRIIGMEALVRWNHPEEGFISPAEFIPVAEITGQIYDLERRIVEKALTQKEIWEKEGLDDIELSINLSSKSIISNLNFRSIELLFSDFDIDYQKIVIEITETAAISDLDAVIERLSTLKSKGIKIALDDFGTGYSSITYLKKLPIDIVKLDESYIGEKDSSIVKFVVSLAHDLGFRVVAEGIETSEQLNYLTGVGCEYGQGYFIGRPMCIEKISELLAEKNIV